MRALVSFASKRGLSYMTSSKISDFFTSSLPCRAADFLGTPSPLECERHIWKPQALERAERNFPFHSRPSLHSPLQSEMVESVRMAWDRLFHNARNWHGASPARCKVLFAIALLSFG